MDMTTASIDITSTTIIVISAVDWIVELFYMCGSVVLWLAHLEWPATAVRIPGRATIPLVATLGKLFTHIASPVSQLQETGVQKWVFGA